jgi:hypothetical protein
MSDMRWSRLLADLESQLNALVSAETAGEIAERTRIETAAVRLADRLRAAQDHPIEVRCMGAATVRGIVAGVGSDWLLIADDRGREALIPLASVTAVAGLGPAVAPPDTSVVAGRLGLRQALRGIARDRVAVLVGLADGSAVTGTVDRVGADFVDLAEHAPGEPRRPTAVRRRLALPLRAIAVVRCR